MDGRLTPEQLDNLRRTDFDAWRRYLDAVAQDQIDSGNDLLDMVGRMTKDAVRKLPKVDPSPRSR
jgi:hypothetical protein